SFIIQYALLPSEVSSATNTGILAEVIPPIGPTASTLWQGTSLTSPEDNNSKASSSLSAQPSNIAAPIHEPCTGCGIFSHSIGGPACNKVGLSSSFNSFITSFAGTTSNKTGEEAIILSITALLASSIVL